MACLQERMKTMQEEYKTDITRLAEDRAKRNKDNLPLASRALARRRHHPRLYKSGCRPTDGPA